MKEHNSLFKLLKEILPCFSLNFLANLHFHRCEISLFIILNEYLTF